MIEQSFIDAGFSFTMAKLLPYIITLLIGLILSYLVIKRLNVKNKWIRIALRTLLVLGPFGIYFALNPIYQGDFSNNAESITKKREMDELQINHLTVISIPGCPYCKEAMTRMLALKKRNPKLDIDYIVCSTDEQSLSFYTEVNEGLIPIKLAKNPEAMAELAQHRFPTFVIAQKEGMVQRWSNDHFGVRALDEVEALAK